MVRVLIVDDHPLFREGLRTAFEGTDIEVVGELADGTSAVAAASATSPDVVLMDLNMPGMSGLEATRLIAAAGPAVLVLSMQDDEQSLFAAMRAGASGYLLKGAGRTEVVRAVCAVADGEAIFGPSVAERVLALFASSSAAGHEPAATAFPALTGRERELLELVALGLGNQAIARRLCLAPKTVRNNVSTILTKVHALDRGDAISKARAAGLGVATPEVPTGPSSARGTR